MSKKKRKRSTIRKRQETILRAADNLQKTTGIDFSHRFMFVGGTSPKSVQKARKESETRNMDAKSPCGHTGGDETVD